MDLAVHDEILWHACVKAQRQLGGRSVSDPRLAFPYLVRGSWMNDMNQVSPLLDAAGNPDVGPQQAALFHGLWKLELEELLTERVLSLPHNETLLPERGKILNAPQNVHGFGRYNPFDHLDVTLDKPGVEYDAAWSTPARFGRASTAHFTVHTHVASRLANSSLLDERFDPQRLTILGRALHTVADFFAHSNYVELLLWSLAWRGRLDPALVDSFNFDDGSNNAGAALFRCPLPPPGPRDGRLLRNAVLWYGPSPEETPLVSALFDTKDTVFSLLHIYAAHLVRTDGKAQTEPALDLAMAVFDIQGAKLIKGAWQLLDTVGEVFRGIGRAARNTLARGLEVVAATKEEPRTREIMELTAKLVRHYSSKEADDWARAGRLEFLARELQLAMAEEMRHQQSDRMLLPHHSLVAKDHVGHEAAGQLRFKLACLLATEVTARILEWHFSAPLPKLADYRAIASKVMVHPWLLLEAAGNGDQLIAQRVRDADGSARWQTQFLAGLDVLEGAL